MVYPPRSSAGTHRYGRKGGAARLRRALLLLAGGASVGGLLWLALWVKQQRGAKIGARPQEEASSPAVPEESAEYVPPFRAATFEGKPFAIASYEGKSAVVLDFWASWCDLCAADMLVLKAAAARFSPDDLTVVGIHRGDTESAERGLTLAARLGIDYVLVQDPEGKLFRLLGLGKPFMPLTLFINEEGKIVDRRFGPKTEEEIRVSMAKIVD